MEQEQAAQAAAGKEPPSRLRPIPEKKISSQINHQGAEGRQSPADANGQLSKT